MNIAAVILAISVACAQNAPSKPVEEPELLVKNGSLIYPVSVDEYVTGVVAAEMPYTFKEEALKAQAVAARSYLYYCMESGREAHDGADVCTDASHCAAYTDSATLSERYGEAYAIEALSAARQATEATSGQVMTYEGEPILAMWHSSSWGWTADSGELIGQVPYLVSVSSPEAAEISRAAFSLDDVRTRLAKAGYYCNLEPRVKIERTASGRCERLTIGNITLSGRQVREIFGLRSCAFTASFSADELEFVVKGYGHGIGMSQNGAQSLAKRGYSYTDILCHYYTGAILAVEYNKK